jgi:DNA-binding response OmpR family regulator
MAALIVLVNAERKTLQQSEAILSEAGYLVAAVSSFEEAIKLLNSVSPDLLVADVRLQGYNGLHLAIRCRRDHPDTPVIITHRSPDRMYEAEAARHGAAFVADPVRNPRFLDSIRTALEEHPGRPIVVRRWARRRAAQRVPVRAAALPAEIVDLSYGGVKLAFDDEREVPGEFLVTFAGTGMTVTARRVWTAPSDSRDGLWCGAEIADPALVEWREFVDSVTARS